MMGRALQLVITAFMPSLLWCLSWGLTANLAYGANWDDNARYPTVQAFLETLDLSAYGPPPGFHEGLWWCNTEKAANVPEEKIEEFFLAGAKDNITVIRLFALMAVTVREQQIALCGSGDALSKVIERNNIHLGLSLPLDNIAVYSWLPVMDDEDPYSIARAIIVYRNTFIHHVEKEVMPADIKVGTGLTVPYSYGDDSGEGALVTLGFHVSSNKVGFEHIHGVEARLHGPLGIVMRLLPFVPAGVHNMYLEQNALFTRALIASDVPHFEDRDIYRIRIEE